MTPMQQAAHASPLPGLMMLVTNHAAALELSPEQISAVKNWRKANHQRSRALVQQILQTESLIATAAMNGAEEENLQRLKDQLLNTRGELLELKFVCVANLKKILDPPQWNQLMALRSRQQRVSNDQGALNDVQAFLRIAPMPKLMLVIIMHSKALKLTPEQDQALEKWRLKNMHTWASLFDQVLREEKLLTANAIALAPAEDLLQRYDSLLEKRRTMAKMSLACRDNMKKILTAAQWQQVTERFETYRNAGI
ncbi:MAG: hypothetical protein KUF74_15770 [Candidatus Thiodiazotropha sp. (ex Ctena orbiculata)]|nr:hypothetical protein [Candidatus Thiodiazotropha taylori]